MEGGEIMHRTVEVNGIRMHVAEAGPPEPAAAPTVVLLHGFPDLWYGWRHQLPALAARGFRAVAPDLRGYGGSDAPADPTAYTLFHVVGDVVALIKSLTSEKVFVVGHDWGALVAWHLCLIRPDLVKALVNMSVAFMPRHPSRSPVVALRDLHGENHYICRFQEPGAAEADFAQAGTNVVLRKFLTYRKPEPFIADKEKGIVGSIDDTNMPSWLSEDDINYYASNFEKTGFTGGLNYYRCMNSNWELTAPWQGVQIKVPVKFIIGDLDLTYHTHGAQNYMHKGGFIQNVPLLQELVVVEGVGHFLCQERPNEISSHICEFFSKFQSHL